MRKFVGNIVAKSRRTKKLTQDEFGKLYSVSGPAIFKFEKGYVRPSLELWLRMAADSNISERSAVLLWLKATLPPKYQDIVELQAPSTRSSGAKSKAPVRKAANYTKCKSRDDLLKKADTDVNFPVALKEFIQDDELWALYSPDGAEINRLLATFAPLGAASKELYREAIAALRMFTGER